MQTQGVDFEDLVISVRGMSRIFGEINLDLLERWFPDIDRTTGIQLIEALMKSKYLQAVGEYHQVRTANTFS